VELLFKFLSSVKITGEFWKTSLKMTNLDKRSLEFSKAEIISSRSRDNNEYNDLKNETTEEFFLLSSPQIARLLE
jgi:hypothetical protein